jgi:transcriptional regulator with XRE-family HTH domain
VAENGTRSRKRKTRLQEAREIIGLTQDEMARRAGIRLRTYQRLESGTVANPPIRYVVNCALALALELSEVCEPEWLAWLPSAPARKPTPLTPKEQGQVELLRRRRRPPTP